MVICLPEYKLENEVICWFCIEMSNHRPQYVSVDFYKSNLIGITNRFSAALVDVFEIHYKISVIILSHVDDIITIITIPFILTCNCPLLHKERITLSIFSF